MLGDLVLLDEDVVQVDAGDGGADDVEDVGGDLLGDVREAVEGRVGL